MVTVTAIVPVYNVKEYLARCLDSLLGQTIPFDKIVVVDDGSTDGCGVICDEYSERYVSIQLIHKENGGLVSAWMEGLKYVDTSHICFIDSDDYVSADYLECLLNSLDGNVDLVSMQCIQFVNKTHQFPLRINSLIAGTYIVDDNLKSILLCDKGSYGRTVAMSRWGKIIRTDLVLEYAKYCTEKISYAEDQQLMIGIFCACQKIKILEEYKYYYQLNPNSILNSYRKDMWTKVVLLMHTILAIPHIDEIPDFEKQYNTQYLLHMAECFRNEFNFHAFNKSFYTMVISHPEIQKALDSYYPDKMRKIDKYICHCAEQSKYYMTYVSLAAFKAYYSIRKMMGMQV